jgi:hypothetical protein
MHSKLLIKLLTALGVSVPKKRTSRRGYYQFPDKYKNADVVMVQKGLRSRIKWKI